MLYAFYWVSWTLFSNKPPPTYNLLGVLPSFGINKVMVSHAWDPIFVFLMINVSGWLGYVMLTDANKRLDKKTKYSVAFASGTAVSNSMMLICILLGLILPGTGFLTTLVWGILTYILFVVVVSLLVLIFSRSTWISIWNWFIALDKKTA